MSVKASTTATLPSSSLPVSLSTLLSSVSEPQKSVASYEWLNVLCEWLREVNREELKKNQKSIVDELLKLMESGCVGPASRSLVAENLVNIFVLGDTFMLFEAINRCNDVLKTKDDSSLMLNARLCSIVVLGVMYLRLGRMTGRSFEESFHILAKVLKMGDFQTRSLIMITFGHICIGLGQAVASLQRELFKLAKNALVDRNAAVRIASAKCFASMAEANMINQVDIEVVATTFFRAFENEDYETRTQLAQALGTVLALAMKPKLPGGRASSFTTTSSTATTTSTSTGAKKVAQGGSGNNSNKTFTLEDVFAILGQGFIKGGSGSGLIKGSSPVSQEVRVGVTHCYVAFIENMGSLWLEKHLQVVLSHILELLAHPKAALTHIDAVYSRRCVGYILDMSVNKMLGEKAQRSACKDLVHIIDRLIKNVDSCSVDTQQQPTKESNLETMHSQHILVVALEQLGGLLLRLGTSSRTMISDSGLKAAEVLLSVLLHPMQAPRLASAYCIGCLCTASPSNLTPLLDRCLQSLESLRTRSEPLLGYSAALSSILSATPLTPLGIPHTRGKMVFNVGEELLRSASQSSKLSRERSLSGWLLISSVMTLGPSVVKGLLPRMMLLWRNAFPRSTKELESEKSRGDAFTWKISLEARSGAMASIHTFLLLNKVTLATEDVLRRLTVPIEASLTLNTCLGSIVKNYSAELKALAAMHRLRLFETLLLMPPQSLENCYTALLRLLVAEFTLADGSTTSTSLLRSLCHSDDAIIIGTKFQDAESMGVEEQLLTNSASGSKAIEHDVYALVTSPSKGSNPGSLPLGVSVVDTSILLFGFIFPRVASKHRLQMFEHFNEQLKHNSGAKAGSKNAIVASAIHTNILAATLAALRALVHTKAKFGNEDVQKPAVDLILGGLSSPVALLRCASAEALGLMSQVARESKLVSEMTQKCFDSLKVNRENTVARMGHALALGCLHRYVGGMGSAQHMHTSVSVLLALGQDNSAAQVQVWALHALALVADSGGPLFRTFVEPTLTAVLKLLLSVPHHSLELLCCLSRTLSALITTLGPDLSANDRNTQPLRSSLLCACSILQHHEHPALKAEAIACQQQLHMFAPTASSLLVPTLCRFLKSRYPVLKKAAVACLRQFTQREAKEVYEQAKQVFEEQSLKDTHNIETLQFNESGLPGVLFTILDEENDETLLANVQDTLNFILSSMAADNLTVWLALLREVLTVSSIQETGSDLSSSKVDDNDDDEATFTSGEEERTGMQPRWTTRVFAAQCLRKIIQDCCRGNRAHFDLSLAREIGRFASKSDFLVLHLSELIRIAFIAATSECDQLRLEGMKILQIVIELFANSPEPELPGHVIMEQYQAQVGAALRPAFAADTPSHVTSAACDVCSAWIGSGVARQLDDLKRVYQLLVTSLDKMRVRDQGYSYNESALTLEKLSILKAWAQVYIVTNDDISSSKLKTNRIEENGDDEEFGDMMGDSKTLPTQNLASLVQSELSSLSKYWLACLKDHALLSLPQSFRSQLPHDGGTFYTHDTLESARPHYIATWPHILEAAAIWLIKGSTVDSNVNEDCNENANDVEPANAKALETLNKERFYLIYGLCLEKLIDPRSSELNRTEMRSCLRTLTHLLGHAQIRQQILTHSDVMLVELLRVLHRTALTRDHPREQLGVIEVLKLSLIAANERLEHLKVEEKRRITPANQQMESPEVLDQLGEGGESGQFNAKNSVCMATLDICMCILVRFSPSLSPRAAKQHQAVVYALSKSKSKSMIAEGNEVVAETLQLTLQLTPLCAPMGALALLPSLLWIHVGTLVNVVNSDANDEKLVDAIIGDLCILAQDKYASHPSLQSRWSQLIRSAITCLLEAHEKKVSITFIRAMLTLLTNKCPLLVTSSMTMRITRAVKEALDLSQNCNKHASRSQVLLVVHLVMEKRGELAIAKMCVSKAVLPRMLDYLLSTQSRLVSTDEELSFTLGCLQVVEELNIEEKDEEGGVDEEGKHLMHFLVPILVSHLIDEDDEKSIEDVSQKARRRRLHSNAMISLTSLGRSKPLALKRVLNRYEELKSRLETALKADHERVRRMKEAEEANRERERRIIEQQEFKPSIKLSMDFSNFTTNKVKSNKDEEGSLNKEDGGD